MNFVAITERTKKNWFHVKILPEPIPHLIDVRDGGWCTRRWWHWVGCIRSTRLAINTAIGTWSCAVWEFQEGRKLLSLFDQSTFMALCISLIGNVFFKSGCWNFGWLCRLGLLKLDKLIIRFLLSKKWTKIRSNEKKSFVLVQKLPQLSPFD